MSNIAIYDPDAVVANQVTQYLTSVNTPDYDSESDKVVNPDLSGLTDVPMKWWKVSGGVVVEMSQGEKDTVDASLLPTIKETRKVELLDEADQILIDAGLSDIVQRRMNTVYSDSHTIRPNRQHYMQPEIDWINQIESDVQAKSTQVDQATTETGVNLIELDAGLTGANPSRGLSGAVTTEDDTSLSTFLNSHVQVCETGAGYSGICGPFYLMQILNHRKDLYNDDENPLFETGHQPILGESGMLVDHADRISSLETIHGKLGWHYQQGLEARYTRPKDLLIYYGWLNSFNYGTNSWTNEKVAQDMAKYSLIVFGDGIQDPSHGDYSNTQVIIPRIKALNPDALIFGYVDTTLTLSNFETKAGQWDTLGVHGVFMDKAGYDYGKTRQEFNDRVDSVHGQSSASLVFANAWNTNHILGTTNDPSYPNSTYNSTGDESNLTNTDWILLESFPVNTTSFTSTGGYEGAYEWSTRGTTMQTLRATYGVNFAAVSVISNGNGCGTDMFDFSFVSALMWSLEGHGSSDTSYGSGSATVDYWTRPDVTKMGVVWSLNASLQEDGGQTGIFHRYVEYANMKLDFSAGLSGAQTSTINKT